MAQLAQEPSVLPAVATTSASAREIRPEPSSAAPVRRELQVAMVTDVLKACAGAPGLEGVMVVPSGPDAAGVPARLAGAGVVAHRAQTGRRG